ncbi:MAG: hypothetical protein H6664_08325 [Ardenticatenaceae bacterium]|nr:hypothetical protein [Ardenticatenaceae bacterium]
MDELTKLGFEHFVVLERQNYLRKIVSSLVAHQTGHYHRQKSASAEAPHCITVDVNHVEIDRETKSLLAFLETYREAFQMLDDLLAKRNSLKLTYESDIERDPFEGYGRMCKFLDIPPHPATIRYAKTNPYPLATIVSNFEEVQQLLAETPYAWMLKN